MTRDDKKRQAGLAAVECVAAGSVVGVGTGSTTNHFIDALPSARPAGAVASSQASALRLAAAGIPVLDLNDVGRLALYVDGADEATARRELIKGGGGALTREKIVAEASDRFVCIVDDSKLVDRLGAFPVPLEVLPMARALVARAVQRFGGRAVERPGFTTDNGNPILDVHGLEIEAPEELETALNQIPGVVTCGLFCRRRADLLIVGGDVGVSRIE